MIVLICGLCAFYTIIHVLFTPFLAWFDFECTRL